MAKTKRYTISAVNAPRSKTDVMRNLAENTDLSRAQVQEVLDAMSAIIKKDLGKSGPGQFTVPGLMKISVQRKPATKARPGVNPFTGEQTIFKAKPARNVVKVRPLKGLKDMV
ncbi:MAG: HU family DNA-binding protein [Dehalococcoidia bacterium]